MSCDKKAIEIASGVSGVVSFYGESRRVGVDHGSISEESILYGSKIEIFNQFG